MPRRQAEWSASRIVRTPLARVAKMAIKPRDEGGEFGEFGAFAELHRPMLERIALRLSGNRELAKDLVQDTLLRALDHFDQIQQRHNPVAWLVKIMTNLYFDSWKHQKVVSKAEPEIAASQTHEAADDSLLDHITDDQLTAAVQTLEPELRELIDLCYLRGMRHREVAAVLKLPIGTVGTRLMRARHRLRELLALMNPHIENP
jgi:RNA polymerase sigma-70 factor (ECF subfamily)